MARLARYTQQTFGTSAGANQMAEFGSFAAASPATFSGATITPAIVQTLSQYASGWFSAIVGANSPCIEDWNALCYLFAYQLTYLLQLGVPEWDSGTTYFIGSIVQDGTGVLYKSITNNNLNNAVTSAANWTPIGFPTQATSIINGAVSPTIITPTAANNGQIYEINNSGGTTQLNLPTGITDFRFTVVDITGFFGTNNMTIHRAASELIQNLGQDMVLKSNFGSWTFQMNANGNWNVIA